MADYALDMLPPLSGILTESVAAVKNREASALDSLLRARQKRCVIFGSGTLGKKAVALLREMGVEPLALCDSSSARWGTIVEGLTVLSPKDAAARFGADAVFFVTIWNDFHWYKATLTRLTALGCTSVSSYAPIFWRFGSRFMDLLLLNEPAHGVYEHLNDVLAAETLWDDDESLATYRANILWRALGDPSHLPYPAPVNTYFPPDIFSILPGEVIVDCGAFDGDTIRFTLGLVGSSFEAIHAIEADTISVEKLDAYLATLPAEVAKKIHKLDCAVGEERCIIQFVMGGSLTSAVGAAGQDVACIPLDELFANTPITFLKMDIEGAEYGALRGGKKIIERDHPILAICVYHTQSDIWRIPLWIRSVAPDYRLYLRAYDGDGFQSVVYAVPPRRVLPAARRQLSPRKPAEALPS